jgi:hypothetical protein
VLATLTFLSSSYAFAQNHAYPPICPDAERADVCELKLQRNNAFDQVALEKHAEASMRDAEDKLASWWAAYAVGTTRKEEYWTNYVLGINDRVAAHPPTELDWWISYGRGLEQQVSMWKEQCAKHHCVPQY